MVSEQDYERLSAYIDDELSSDDRAVLEAQLLDDATLQSELTALRAMSLVVREMPPALRPRDFRLTAEMVAPPSPPKFLVFPATTFTSVITTAAAVLLLAWGVVLLLQSPHTMQNNVAQTLPESVAIQPTPTIAAPSLSEIVEPTAEAEIEEEAVTEGDLETFEMGEAPAGAASSNPAAGTGAAIDVLTPTTDDDMIDEVTDAVGRSITPAAAPQLDGSTGIEFDDNDHTPQLRSVVPTILPTQTMTPLTTPTVFLQPPAVALNETQATEAITDNPQTQATPTLSTTVVVAWILIIFGGGVLVIALGILWRRIRHSNS